MGFVSKAISGVGKGISRGVSGIGQGISRGISSDAFHKFLAPALGVAGFALGGPAGAALGASLGSGLSGQRNVGHILGTGLKGFGVASGLGALAGSAGLGAGTGFGAMGAGPSMFGSMGVPGAGGTGSGMLGMLSGSGASGGGGGLAGLLGSVPGVGGPLSSLAGMAGLGVPGSGGALSSLAGLTGTSGVGGGINPLQLLGGILGYNGSQSSTKQANQYMNQEADALANAQKLSNIDPAALAAQEARAKDTLRGAQAERGIFNSGVAARQEAEVMPMVNAQLQQLAFQNAVTMGSAYNPMISALMSNSSSFSNPFSYMGVK